MKKSEPKAIVIWGVGSTGKTSTLNLLMNTFVGKKVSFIKKPASKALTDNTFCVFEYKGKHIAIMTVGDDRSILSDYYSRIDKIIKNSNISIDIYVCASRTKGSSVNFLKETFGEDNIIWFSKMSINSSSKTLCNIKSIQDEHNSKQADLLLSLINEII